MAQAPNILSPREPIGTVEIGSDGKPTGGIVVNRSWWRFFNSGADLSGKLAKPVTIAPNSIITAGAINSGDTVTLANSPPLTVLGNPDDVAAQPVPMPVDPSLSMNGGTLAVRSLPPGTLSGNPGPGSAPPSEIILGTDFVMTGNVLNVNAGAGGGVANLALIETVAFWGM